MKSPKHSDRNDLQRGAKWFRPKCLGVETSHYGHSVYFRSFLQFAIFVNIDISISFSGLNSLPKWSVDWEYPEISTFILFSCPHCIIFYLQQYHLISVHSNTTILSPEFSILDKIGPRRWPTKEHSGHGSICRDIFFFWNCIVSSRGLRADGLRLIISRNTKYKKKNSKRWWW